MFDHGRTQLADQISSVAGPRSKKLQQPLPDDGPASVSKLVVSPRFFWIDSQVQACPGRNLQESEVEVQA